MSNDAVVLLREDHKEGDRRAEAGLVRDRAATTKSGKERANSSHVPANAIALS